MIGYGRWSLQRMTSVIRAKFLYEPMFKHLLALLLLVIWYHESSLVTRTDSTDSGTAKLFLSDGIMIKSTYSKDVFICLILEILAIHAQVQELTTNEESFAYLRVIGQQASLRLNNASKTDGLDPKSGFKPIYKCLSASSEAHG